jgi:hypothetical protein
MGIWSVYVYNRSRTLNNVLTYLALAHLVAGSVKATALVRNNKEKSIYSII